MENWKVIVISAIVSSVVSWMVTDLRCGKHLKNVDTLVKETMSHTRKVVHEVLEYIEKKFNN